MISFGTAVCSSDHKVEQVLPRIMEEPIMTDTDASDDQVASLLDSVACADMCDSSMTSLWPADIKIQFPACAKNS